MSSAFHEIAKRKADRELDRIFALFEPKVGGAFLEAVEEVKDQINMAELTTALRIGNVTEAIAIVGSQQLASRLRGVGLEPGAESFEDFVMGSFREGGVMGAVQLPRPTALQVSLDLTNPEAVRFARDVLPARIREISAEQTLAVQDAVLRGFEEGRSAPLIAREIRGSVGLTQSQSTAVGNFRRQLETGKLGNTTPPFNRRLSASDKSQARALFNSAKPNQTKINSLVNRYETSLLNRRSKDIARTEVHNASISGQNELWRQADEQGLIDKRRTRRIWIPTRDDVLRDDHRAVPRLNPDGVLFDQPFLTPVGLVMHPGQSGNAAFDINCRCAEGLIFTDPRRA